MKLKAAEIDGTPLKWFQSYLNGRFQSILWNSNLSKSLPINRGVPQGSILGPILFLVMIYDMPRFLANDRLLTSSRLTGYANDTTVYVRSKSIEHLIFELERIATIMIKVCNENGLIINSQKTQILCTAREEIKVKIGNDSVLSNKTISLLGLEYDENLSTAPNLRKLSREATVVCVRESTKPILCSK